MYMFCKSECTIVKLVVLFVKVYTLSVIVHTLFVIVQVLFKYKQSDLYAPQRTTMSIGTELLRPYALTGVYHMRMMQYEIVLNLMLRAEMNRDKTR